MEYLTLLSALGLALGVFFLSAGAIIAILTFVGLILTIFFYKTRKILIPTATMMVLSVAEAPMRYLFCLFGLDDRIISNMIIDVRNILYRDQFESVPYEKRAIFAPQCLRNPKCPAPLTSEGIMCINCGRCGLGSLKEEAEQVGSLFFIAPGSSLINRMVKKYGPEAILGIGCHLEVKEGIQLIRKAGLPVQGVKLSIDGCVDTRTDISQILELIVANKEKYGKYRIKKDPKMMKKAMEISSMWKETDDMPFEIVSEKQTESL